jgi:uncharacterized protein YcaQ
LDQVLEVTQVFQLDTVNVFERAHLLPAFSRMGNYSRDAFESWAFGEPQVTEYWAHCAALIPLTDWPLFEFRRQEYLRRDSILKMFKEQKQLVTWVLDQIRANGPMLVSEFEHDQNKRKGDWWGWSEIKIILERLYFCGELVSAGRTRFSRRYALPEQVSLPQSNLSQDEQKLELIRKSVKALGVGTEDDIADYFRFYVTEARPYISQLLEAGELLKVEVEGWAKPGITLANQLSTPEIDLGDRPVRLLSPFDPVVWRRERAKRLYDFDYLIEIYVPEAKRQYGYYTLPILYKDQLVGRVDLKNDRKAKSLNVLSLWAEPHLGKQQLNEVTPYLVQELHLAKDWVGAEKLNPPSKGNWALGRV